MMKFAYHILTGGAQGAILTHCLFSVDRVGTVGTVIWIALNYYTIVNAVTERAYYGED